MIKNNKLPKKTIQKISTFTSNTAGNGRPDTGVGTDTTTTLTKTITSTHIF